MATPVAEEPNGNPPGLAVLKVEMEEFRPPEVLGDNWNGMSNGQPRPAATDGWDEGMAQEGLGWASETLLGPASAEAPAGGVLAQDVGWNEGGIGCGQLGVGAHQRSNCRSAEVCPSGPQLPRIPLARLVALEALVCAVFRDFRLRSSAVLYLV